MFFRLGILVTAFICVYLRLILPVWAQEQVKAQGASKLNVPPEAKEGLRLVYSGEPEKAIPLFRKIQQDQPEHPLGYLLEANALWWKFYCEACEIKYNTIDAWKRTKISADEAYLALTDRAIRLADAALKKKETAEMRLYAGMAWALKARLYGLREEGRNTARAGVKAREHFLRAIQLDPNLADAYTGLGLYNYLADALSVPAKILRFFLAIPGGDKKEGLRQLDIAMGKGELTREEARFYAAKCLRNYDQKYERAIALMRPLVAANPRNALFQLILGDLYAKLRRNEQAAEHYNAAKEAVAAGNGAQGNAAQESPCATRVKQVVALALKSLRD